ncbi:hypothetical protein P4C99_14240 [Pontiellaceae bacterium B1224]|nr:hypothetical protein [Pontiellaceae bacterium B1224]
MIETVIKIQPGIDIAMTMLIWLVQLVIYPAYLSIDKKLFQDWHHRYMRTISFIVIPLILAQGLCIGFQCLENFSLMIFLQAVMFIVAWTTTFTQSVPCHKKLQANGWNEGIIKRLILTNWIRTVAWTSVMLLDWF